MSSKSHCSKSISTISKCHSHIRSISHDPVKYHCYYRYMWGVSKNFFDPFHLQMSACKWHVRKSPRMHANYSIYIHNTQHKTVTTLATMFHACFTLKWKIALKVWGFSQIWPLKNLRFLSMWPHHTYRSINNSTSSN